MRSIRFFAITTMLKAAASIRTKISSSSRNSPLPAEDSRLEPFQEFIAAEELIMHSYVNGSTHVTHVPTPGFSFQELNTGFDMMFEALKAYVGGEGEGESIEVRS